jgi:hypothetical protein
MECVHRMLPYGWNGALVRRVLDAGAIPRAGLHRSVRANRGDGKARAPLPVAHGQNESRSVAA